MTQHQIIIQQMSFNLPNGTPLLKQLALTIPERKIGLVGRNGIGKSTLMRLLAGEIQPTSGGIHCDGKIAFVAQSHTAASQITIAEYLGYAQKIAALRRIEAGSLAEQDFAILNEDWRVMENAQAALQTFNLQYLDLMRPLASLSGGEMTRLALTKAFASAADFLLLDEPTNHLDSVAREHLYQALLAWRRGLIVASHDRRLLSIMQEIIEITTLGINMYGGNYAFYSEQKQLAQDAKAKDLADAKKALAQTTRSVQLTKEKHEQRQAHGRQLRRSGSQSTMILDAMENRSTKSLGELSTRHQHMLQQAEATLTSAREQVEIIDEIHVSLPATYVPAGKILLEIENLMFRYTQADKPVLTDFNLTLKGAERIAITGANGTGKSTLLRLILGKLTPDAGRLFLGTTRYKFLDQHLHLLDAEKSVLDNFLMLNPDATQHEAHCALAAFLFKNISAHKLVKELSGGEKLRAALACTLMAKAPPQLLVFDEPTNHLDLHSLNHIETALNCYEGGMIVVSHDEAFLTKIQINKKIAL